MYNIDQNKIIGIYGAGNLGNLVSEIVKEKFANQVFFIDDTPAKQGTYINNIKTISKDEYHHINQPKETIVSIFKPGHSFLKTAKKFEEQYNITLTSFIKILQLIDDRNFSFLFLENREILESKLELYNEIKNLFADELSKEILDAHLAIRLDADFSKLKVTPRTKVDFLQNIIDERITYVDFGPYDGDTVLDFIELSHGKFHHIFAVEPDADNYNKLSINLKNHLSDNKYTLQNKALYINHGKIKFQMDGNVSSKICDQGNVEIETVTLDDFADYNCYFKLDIEGQEEVVIISQLDYIKRKKPIMAISVYHQPDDLLNILTMLQKLDAGYKFYLRCHGFDGEDLMLYCI